MPRKPDAALLPGVCDFIRDGEAPRPFAVPFRHKGQRVDAWVMAHGAVPDDEDPADTAQRNAIAGAPVEFATSRRCPRCGPLAAGDSPLCPTCSRRVIVSREVIRRAPPVEYGPTTCWEERREVCGWPVKAVRHGRLSEMRRACPDQATVDEMERLRVLAGKAPEKSFRLASC